MHKYIGLLVSVIFILSFVFSSCNDNTNQTILDNSVDKSATDSSLLIKNIIKDSSEKTEIIEEKFADENIDSVKRKYVFNYNNIYFEDDLKCSPDTLKRNDTLVITLPENHPQYLGISGVGKRDFFYLQYEDFGARLMSDKDFKNLRVLKIPQNQLSITYNYNGEKGKRPIFVKEGRYLIVFSTNLETEFENMNAMFGTVYFKP